MVLYPLAVVLLAQVGLLLLIIIGYQFLQKRRLLKELEGLKSEPRPQPKRQEPLLEAESGPSFDKEQASLLLNRMNQGTQNLVSEVPAAKALAKRQAELIEALSDCLDISLDATQEPEESVVLADDEEDTSDDLLSQEELDKALGQGPDKLEGFEEELADFDEELEGLDGLEDLEKDDELEGTADELEDLDAAREDADEPESYDPLVESKKDESKKVDASKKTEGSEKASKNDKDAADKEQGDLPEDTLQKTLDNLDDFDFSDLEAELLKDDDDKKSK